MPTTSKQTQAAKKNIKKAQQAWQAMTPRQRALAQPQGKDRANPGEKGTGDFYRIVVRDKHQFTSFRTHDVGEKGGIERIAGHRRSGSWDTQAWLIEKKLATPKKDTLISSDPDVKELLATLGSPPMHQEGDIYTAKPRPNVPEKDKPTPAQKKAWAQNSKKARQAAGQ